MKTVLARLQLRQRFGHGAQLLFPLDVWSRNRRSAVSAFAQNFTFPALIGTFGRSQPPYKGKDVFGAFASVELHEALRVQI